MIYAILFFLKIKVWYFRKNQFYFLYFYEFFAIFMEFLVFFKYFSQITFLYFLETKHLKSKCFIFFDWLISKFTIFWNYFIWMLLSKFNSFLNSHSQIIMFFCPIFQYSYTICLKCARALDDETWESNLKMLNETN